MRIARCIVWQGDHRQVGELAGLDGAESHGPGPMPGRLPQRAQVQDRGPAEGGKPRVTCRISARRLRSGEGSLAVGAQGQQSQRPETALTDNAGGRTRHASAGNKHGHLPPLPAETARSPRRRGNCRESPPRHGRCQELQVVQRRRPTAGQWGPRHRGPPAAREMAPGCRGAMRSPRAIRPGAWPAEPCAPADRHRLPQQFRMNRVRCMRAQTRPPGMRAATAMPTRSAGRSPPGKNEASARSDSALVS